MSEWREIGQIVYINKCAHEITRKPMTWSQSYDASTKLGDAGYNFDQRQSERHSYGRLWDEVRAA